MPLTPDQQFLAEVLSTIWAVLILLAVMGIAALFVKIRKRYFPTRSDRLQAFISGEF